MLPLLAAFLLFQTDARDHFDRAMRQQQAGDLRGAAQSLEQATHLAPGNFSAHANLGAVRAQLGDYTGAIKAYHKALALNPKANRVRLNIGIAYVRSGNFLRALQSLDEFLAGEGDNNQARDLRALCLHQLGRFAESASEYQAQIVRRGDELALLYGLGSARSAARDTAGAEQAFGRLFALFPDAPETRLLRVQQMLALGRSEEAIVELDGIGPGLRGVELWRGIALEKAGRQEEALEAYRKEIASTGDLLAHYGAGVLEARFGDPERAPIHLSAAMSLDSDRYNVSYHLGHLRLRLGQPAKALPFAEQSVKRDPKSASAHYLLMQVYQKLGRTEDARRQAGVVRELRASEPKP